MSSQRVRKAVIPAAGLGTRFLPATKAVPKEMLPVVDKPTLQYVVEEAVSAGIDDILIIVGRGKTTIQDHFDRSFELEHTLEAGGKFAELEAMRAIADRAVPTAGPWHSPGPWSRRGRGEAWLGPRA